MHKATINFKSTVGGNLPISPRVPLKQKLANNYVEEQIVCYDTQGSRG